MRVLAIDTSSDRIRLALGDGRACVARDVAARGAHDEKLFAAVDALLKKARLRRKDVDAIAAACGPGSFTGIRVGMTFAAVLAQALGKPAVGVSLLEAEAERRFAEGAERVAVVLPSSRDERFVQFFERGRPPTEPKWLAAEAWPAAFKKACGAKPALLAGSAAAQAAARLDKPRPAVAEPRKATAADLIVPALRKLEAGERELAPLYLKPAYYERNPPRLVR